MFLPFQGILFRFHVSFLWCSNANHFFKPKNMQKITLTLEITTWDDVEEVGKTKKRKTGEGCFDGHKNPLKIKKKSLETKWEHTCSTWWTKIGNITITSVWKQCLFGNLQKCWPKKKLFSTAGCFILSPTETCLGIDQGPCCGDVFRDRPEV